MSESVSDVGVEWLGKREEAFWRWARVSIRGFWKVADTVSGEVSFIRSFIGRYQILWLQPLQTALSIREI